MPTTDNDGTDLGPGQVRFYDNYVPTLVAGDYTIDVTQRLNPTTTPVIDENSLQCGLVRRNE